ncbi:helix-turn-helix domain-containing protein [Glycomyces tritici]|uniref:Helix-turn-helix transcriptional regulator n=1 Tax=Glycomyces tritici TaxID=2665176 RepID=A0ABT7YXQ0_9ACTN|nr:helix-turn-helix transcriptional regulator [Glycomyces tritici]MDN3243124.1 helix-turn-helix transcriptional regulator [Glycomyces tritici]
MMVKNRQDRSAGILEVGFRAPIGSPAGVEVVDLGELRRRNLPTLARLQRPHFHQILTLSEGRLDFMVDFVDFEVGPGDWLWVRPGQVQHWGALDGVEGTMILFENDFLDPETAEAARVDEPGGPTRFPSGACDDALEAARAHLDREFRSFGELPLPIHLAAMSHLLAVLVLRLGHCGTGEHHAGESGEAFRRFRYAVERGFARSRRVEDYAAQLGYSPRTLARAAIAATGMGAKEFIDQRIILEAKRLLAHSDRTAARIARDLGFNDATNFSKYFQQRVGQTPIAFRTTARRTTAPKPR